MNDARAFSQCCVCSFIFLVFLFFSRSDHLFFFSLFLVLSIPFFCFFSFISPPLLDCCGLLTSWFATTCYGLLSYSYLFQPVTTCSFVLACCDLLIDYPDLLWLFYGLLNPSNVLMCLGLFWLPTICQIFAWLATDCRVFLACRGLQRRTTRERAKLTDINFKTNIC